MKKNHIIKLFFALLMVTSLTACNDSGGFTTGSEQENGNGIECTDYDNDGYFLEQGCQTPIDCDDEDEKINPSADEICDDQKDNDCDGKIDSDDPDCEVCQDADKDGYKDSSCGGNDCDDRNPNIHPGAIEICGNGIDEDCSGADLTCPQGCTDNDHDGYGIGCPLGDDCDDNNPNIHPGAREICGNGIDEDCSKTPDDGYMWMITVDPAIPDIIIVEVPCQ